MYGFSREKHGRSRHYLGGPFVFPRLLLRAFPLVNARPAEVRGESSSTATGIRTSLGVPGR